MPHQIDTKKLVKLYEIQGLTLLDIAKQCEITHQAVHQRLIKAGIKLRQRNERNSPPIVDFDRLYQLYVTDSLSFREIALLLKKTQIQVIRDLENHGISKRSRGASRRYPKLDHLKIGESVVLKIPDVKNPYTALYDVASSSGIRVSVKRLDAKYFRVTRVEMRLKSTNEKWRRAKIQVEDIRLFYETKGWSVIQIAEKFGVTPRAIYIRIAKAGIVLRTKSKKD